MKSIKHTTSCARKPVLIFLRPFLGKWNSLTKNLQHAILNSCFWVKWGWCVGGRWLGNDNHAAIEPGTVGPVGKQWLTVIWRSVLFSCVDLIKYMYSKGSRGDRSGTWLWWKRKVGRRRRPQEKGRKKKTYHNGGSVILYDNPDGTKS